MISLLPAPLCHVKRLRVASGVRRVVRILSKIHRLAASMTIYVLIDVADVLRGLRIV